MFRSLSIAKIVVPFAFVAAMFPVGCKTKDKTTTTDVVPVSNYGSITVNMSNEVDGQKIALGAINYTNSSGNRYSVDVLKYYISYFTLIRDDNTEFNFMNHKLIDASDTSTCHFSMDSLPNGSYTSVRFYLGVDSSHNHTGLQEGDLDPLHGMIWNWFTGYIFFKHEGKFMTDTGNSFVLYHYGTDTARTIVTIPITKFQVAGDKHTLNLKFNLNALYNSPNQVDFVGNNSHQSADFSDQKWIKTLRQNFPQAFTFDKVN